MSRTDVANVEISTENVCHSLVFTCREARELLRSGIGCAAIFHVDDTVWFFFICQFDCSVFAYNPYDRFEIFQLVNQCAHTSGNLFDFTIFVIQGNANRTSEVFLGGAPVRFKPFIKCLELFLFFLCQSFKFFADFFRITIFIFCISYILKMPVCWFYENEIENIFQIILNRLRNFVWIENFQA